MINTMVSLSDIDWERKDPGDLLLNSIRTRGMAIPVHVNRRDERYECVDGRKRLTACEMLAKEDPRFSRVEVLLMNDYSKAGSAFWGNTQNKH